MPSVDHLITTKMVAPVMRYVTGGRKHQAPQRHLPVLMYHSLSEEAERGVRGYYRLTTPPVLFRQHLQVIREAGFIGLSLSTAWRWWSQPARTETNVPTMAHCVAITFDDGYRNFLSEGWPALAEFGFSATIFLPSAFIGSEGRSFKERPCLNWNEVRELQRAGNEFGSHTVNHPKLWELAPDRLQEELARSKATIEDQLSAPVNTFAHPYAFPLENREYVTRFRDTMIRTGYKLGVTTTLGRVAHGDDPLILKRLPVNGADDASLLRAKLEGAYDWLAFPQSGFKKLKSVLGR